MGAKFALLGLIGAVWVQVPHLGTDPLHWLRVLSLSLLATVASGLVGKFLGIAVARSAVPRTLVRLERSIRPSGRKGG
jgi:hypothetical protein